MRGQLNLNVTQNSVKISNGQQFYLVGYRNDLYQKGEWIVKMSTNLEHCRKAVAEVRQERLNPTVHIWAFTFQQGIPILTSEQEIDY